MLFQHCGLTLIRRWKWNKIWRQIFTVAQRSYKVNARRWNNVETTLHNVHTTLYRCCFNVASTLVRTISNPIGLVMIMDWQIDECFYSAKWENIFINNSTTTRILRNLIRVVHIVIHNGKIWKNKINILYFLKKTNLTAERKAHSTV